MSKKLINMGYDPGRDLAKIYMDNGVYMNLNIISDGYERRGLDEETGDLQNFLDVEVSRGNQVIGRYFVGGMAFKHNNGDLRWTTRAVPKFSDIEVVPDDIIKMITNIAYTQVQVGSKKSIRLRLGTGSATEDYFENPEVLFKFKTVLQQPYTVKFLHPLFNEAVVNINIDEVYFKPEGTATVISSCYDDNLQVRDFVKKNMKEGTSIFGLNIGSTTSDAAIMNPDMTFNSKGFFGIPVGTHDAHNKIRMQIKHKYGYDLNTFKLAHYLQNYKEIKYRGQTINLEQIKKGPLDSLFANLHSQFYDQCSLKNIDLGESGTFIVAGGGVLELGDRLNNFINGVPTRIETDPLFQDARGYWIECKFAEAIANKKAQDVFGNPEDEE